MTQNEPLTPTLSPGERENRRQRAAQFAWRRARSEAPYLGESKLEEQL